MAGTEPAARTGHNRGAEIGVHDFFATGPGTIAGRYLRSFWQPVCRSQDVPPGKAKPLKIMSEEFAIFRGADGEIALLEARCAHRGARLSIGWVEGGNIKCAYHGWTYDASGQCVRQPAEPAPFCDKVKVRSYPVREYLGLVFAYLGEGEPPAFVRSPEFETDKGYSFVTTDIWPANYWTQLENAVDYAHTEYLHWHFHYKNPDRVEVSERPYGVRVHVPGRNRTAASDMYFVMPNTHEWSAPPGDDPTMANFARSWRIPRDDDSHIRFDCRVFPYGDPDDEAWRAKIEKQAPPRTEVGLTGAFAQQILDGTIDFQMIKDDPGLVRNMLTTVQDCAVMASMSPMVGRQHKEMLGQTDLAIAHLRRLWRQELQAFAAGGKPRDWTRPDSLWEALAPAPDA